LEIQKSLEHRRRGDEGIPEVRDEAAGGEQVTGWEVHEDELEELGVVEDLL